MKIDDDWEWSIARWEPEISSLERTSALREMEELPIACLALVYFCHLAWWGKKVGK